MDSMEVLVEYETPVIRKIMVRCPHCGNYFNGADVFGCCLRNSDNLYDLSVGLEEGTDEFLCPKCGYHTMDGLKMRIKETREFPKALTKQIKWV